MVVDFAYETEKNYNQIQAEIYRLANQFGWDITKRPCD